MNVISIQYMLGRHLVKLLLALTWWALFSLAHAQVTSTLFGENGEVWNPAGRLPDYASAGYQSRTRPIPSPGVVVDVKAFGAVGNGEVDDSQAFANAIAAAQNGAILVPAGRYKITQILQLSRSHLVLRGEGPGKSVLYFPKPLSEVDTPLGTDSDWPFKGGFIWVEGANLGVPLTHVVAAAERGTRQLRLASVAGIAVGQYLRLTQYDEPTRGLIKEMQGGIEPQSDQIDYVAEELGDPRKVQDWLFKVQAIHGDSVVLDRPLRTKVSLDWGPQIHTHQPTVREVGVEGLTFEFLGRPKKPHLTEEGFNAVSFKSVTDAWVRNVEIIDSDYGINARAFVYNSQFEDVTFRAVKRASTSPSCHHGLNVSILSQDNLFNRFRFNTYCEHDVTVEAYANGNVFSNGVFARATLDHHKAAPYENLFTNLHTVDGSVLYKSGGAKNRGPNAGVREAFWGITAGNSLATLPSKSMFPHMIVVGMAGYTESFAVDRWVEVTGASGVKPANLHEAQMAFNRGVYEAESATLSGAKARTIHTSPTMRPGAHTGGGFVDFINAYGDFVEWSVRVPTTGNYRLDIRYAIGKSDKRTLSLSVNGAVVVPAVSFDPTSGWDDWRTKSVNLSLPVGNTVKIRLTAVGTVGPDIDSLTLVPL